MKKQISEKFARELLDNIEGKFLDDDEFIMSETDTINKWKQKGWIEKSREEEIKEEILKTENKPEHSLSHFKHLSILQRELIDILENKDK